MYYEKMKNKKNITNDECILYAITSKQNELKIYSKLELQKTILNQD